MCSHPGGPIPRSTDSLLRPRSTVLARGRHHHGPPLQLQDPASAGPRFGTPRQQRESYTAALRGDRTQQGRCNRAGGHRQSAPALLCRRSTQGRARRRQQTRPASAARRCACRWTWWSHPRGVRRKFMVPGQSERRSARSASTRPAGGRPCRPLWPRLSTCSTGVTPRSRHARRRRSRARRTATTRSSAQRDSRWRCSRCSATGTLSPRKRDGCRRSLCGRKRRRPGKPSYARLVTNQPARLYHQRCNASVSIPGVRGGSTSPSGRRGSAPPSRVRFTTRLRCGGGCSSATGGGRYKPTAAA